METEISTRSIAIYGCVLALLALWIVSQTRRDVERRFRAISVATEPEERR